MALATYQITAFSGGEIGQFAQGRTDSPNYKYALNVCLNGMPIELGTWVRRPGTRWVAQTFGGQPGVLFSFAFKEALPYTIELTNQACRFIAATQSTVGLGLVGTNDPQTIIAISTASPAVVQTAAASGWSTGDHVLIPNVAYLEYREFAIAVIDTTHFSITDQVTGAPIDGSQIGFVPAGTQALRVLKLGSPYTAPGTTTGIDQVRKIQAEKTAIMLHPAVTPYALTTTNNPGNTVPAAAGTFYQFQLGPATFTDGPYLDQFIGSVITANGSSGSIQLQTSGAPFPGFANADVGRLIRLFTQPPAYNSGTAYVLGNVVARYVDPVSQPTVATYYVALANTSNNTPELSPSSWSLVTGSACAVWTWGTITVVNSASNVSIVVNGPPLLFQGSPIYAWNFGAYGGANGYPTCGVYYDGRAWFGGAIDNRIDGCVANGVVGSTINMAPTGADGTVGDGNAIAAIFDADDVNPVVAMAHHQQGIICMTQGGEWLVSAPSAGGIAPNNIQANRVTQIGSSNTEVRYAEHTLLFIQHYGRKIIEYFADVFSGKLSGPNLSALWKHLTKGGIKDIAYQQELSPTIWALVPPNQYTASGLISATYKRDTLASAQGPTLNGAARHNLGSGRVVESISIGPSASGTSDSLMMITNNPSSPGRQIEVLTDILDEGSTLLQAQYVDGAVAPIVSQAPPAAGMPYGGLILSGLWPLNGQTITTWAGGLDCGDMQVISGAITIPYGDGISGGTARGLFTQSYVASLPGIPIWCGYTYTSQGQLVRPSTPQESGSRNGPAFGKVRRHHYAFVQLEGAVTSSISFGFDNYPFMPLQFKTANPPVEQLLTVQTTGVFRLQPQDGDTFDGELKWQITRPYPGNIVSVGGALDTKDV